MSTAEWGLLCTAEHAALHAAVASRRCGRVACRGQADTQANSLRRLLRDRFRYNAAVSLQWVLFGSSGYKDPPPLGQLDGFRRCTGVLSKQMKCIGNTYWFNHVNTFIPEAVHQCSFRCAALSGRSAGVSVRCALRRRGGGGHRCMARMPCSWRSCMCTSRGCAAQAAGAALLLVHAGMMLRGVHCGLLGRCRAH